MAITFANMSSSHPRISFSHDFVESNFLSHQLQRPEPPPSSSGFEFSISNYPVSNYADELFSKGKLVPFNDGGKKKTTLREEMLTAHEERDFGLPKGKGSRRWREILGLKKAHVGSRKHAKSDGPMEKRSSVGYESETHSSMSFQESENDGGLNRRDGEFIFRM